MTATLPAPFRQSADARLDYRADWSEWLGGDIITSAAWTVSPAENATVDDTDLAPTISTVWITNLTGPCDLICQVTTNGGRIDSKAVFHLVLGD